MSWYKAATPESFGGNNVELVDFATGTDEQIATMIDAYYLGKLTLAQIQDVWNEGDVRTIQIGDPEETIAIATSGTYNNNTWSVGESHRPQQVQIQILGFDHDTLSVASGSITKALMTIDLKACLRDANVTNTTGANNTEMGYMSNYNINYWSSCPRRAWCNGGFYKALPDYIRSRVKPVNKLTSEGNKSSSIITTSDYCFLLSEKEIFGTTTYSYNGEGTQYSLYSKASTNIYKMPGWNSSNPNSSYWFERSPYYGNSIAFCCVSNTGMAEASGTDSTWGLAPAFCL